MSKFTLKVEADNWMEALSRVTGVFEKRNIAIDSIKALTTPSAAPHS